MLFCVYLHCGFGQLNWYTHPTKRSYPHSICLSIHTYTFRCRIKALVPAPFCIWANWFIDVSTMQLKVLSLTNFLISSRFYNNVINFTFILLMQSNSAIKNVFFRANRKILYLVVINPPLSIWFPDIVSWLQLLVIIYCQYFFNYYC